MTPATEPFAAKFETLNLIKQNDLTDESLFYKDKKGNIFPYLKTDICDKIDVFKPCTFFPILQELDIPFYEWRWLGYIERAIEGNIPKEKIALDIFGRYLGWCKLYDNKNRGFKDSDKFFTDWLMGSDYFNFHYIYDNPPYWKFSYYKEKIGENKDGTN